MPATIPLIQSLGMEIQRAKNMHQFRSYTYLFMAILNVVISYFLAKQWGEIGAAFGTTLSLLIANGLIMNIYYHKFIGLDIIKFWKEIFSFVPALICPLIAGIVLNMIGISSMLCFIVHVLIYIIIYLFSFYLFGFNKDEKNQLNRIFYKLNIVKKYKGDN